jgi:predicted nucleotidyltransferase
MSVTPKCVLTSGESRFESTPDTFFLAYRGSVAHGMFIPSSDPKSIDDIDLMGFAFGDPEHYFGLQEWGSRGTKEIKPGCYDVVLYEIRKAVALLLQGNPNIMSMLWLSPEHILIREEPAKRLIENRHLFLGKHIYDAFAGYAHQQTREDGNPRSG